MMKYWKDPRETHELIFDLTKDEVQSIVENIADEPVDAFGITIEHEKQGLDGICGEYVIPTLSYTTRSGRRGKRAVFVRRPNINRPGISQLHHYTFFENSGVPVPRLYGALTDSKQREVLFLEYLQEITVEDHEFLNDVDHFLKFLDVIAHLNAVEPTVDYSAEVGRDMAYRGGYTRNWNTWLPWSIHVLKRIWDHAAKGELGCPIKKFCSASEGRLYELCRIARDLINRISQFQVGIIHGDFYPGNIAWRRATQELVIFDFEDVMFDVRFYDVAICLGAPDDVGLYCVPQRELAEHYLQEYSCLKRNSLDMTQFLEEIYTIWLARKLNLWEFLPAELHGPHYQPGNEDEQRRKRREDLHRHLDILFRQIAVVNNGKPNKWMQTDARNARR